MKRRKLLTSASALAGAALTGCGGGDEDGTLGGDPSSQIAAYVLPATLVPKNAQWHVEVSFFTQNQCKVSLKLGTSFGLMDSAQIAYKAYTTGTSHRLNFAVMRCNGTTTTSNFDDLTLIVEEWAVGSPVYIANGGQYVARYGIDKQNTQTFQYTVYNDWEVPEYEWTCRSVYNNKLLCRVRFFQLVGDEAYAFPAGQYIVPITPTSTHPNIFGLTRAYPVQHATNLRMVNHEVAVIQAANNKDTICIPNPRATGHYELVPSYLAASNAEKPFIRHRMGRHIDRFSKATRASYVMDTPDDEEVHHLLGNEIVRMLGGKTLIDHYNNVRDKATASITNNIDHMGSAIFNFCKSNLPALSSQAMDDQTRALLDTTDNDEQMSNVAGGRTVSTSLQFGFALTGKDFPWPGFEMGAGFRISFGLSRYSVKYATKYRSPVNSYTIDDIASQGLKVGSTFILKGFQGSSCLIGDVSGDVEFNFNMTTTGTVTRLDSIAIDPVFDIDTRTWVGGLVAGGLARLLSPVIGGLQAIDAIPQKIAYSPPAFMSSLGYEMGSVASKLEASSAQLVNAGIKSFMNPMLKVAETFTGVGGRTWGTLEVAILRTFNPNSDVNDPTIPLRSGFRSSGFGWQPGLKYIAGFGIANKYTVGTASEAMFMRVVTVTDIFGVYGNAKFMQAGAFQWSH